VFYVSKAIKWCIIPWALGRYNMMNISLMAKIIYA
jgi:hypothetical protein